MTLYGFIDKIKQAKQQYSKITTTFTYYVVQLKYTLLHVYQIIHLLGIVHHFPLQYLELVFLWGECVHLFIFFTTLFS